MNTLIIAKMTKVSYEDWKIKFDEDAEVQSKMMRNTSVGKVDDNTAMVLTEVFNPVASRCDLCRLSLII